MKKLSEFLTKENWTRQVLARDGGQAELHPHDPRATKWCLFGAAVKLYFSPDEAPAHTDDCYKLFPRFPIEVQDAMRELVRDVWYDGEEEDEEVGTVDLMIEVNDGALDFETLHRKLVEHGL